MTRLMFATTARRLFLLLFLFVSAPALLAAPRPPLPPWPETYLYQWPFDEPYVSASLTAPVLSTTTSGISTLSSTTKGTDAPVYVESWSGYAFNRQGRQVVPIQFPLQAAKGYPVLAGGTGTLRFWFSPRWTSGPGPGAEARLLDMVSGSGRDSVSWWTLRVSADGSTLAVAGQTEKGLADLVKTRIQWTAGQWHLITLIYTPTHTVLSVDAQTVAKGAALPEIPAPAVAFSGLVLGSDARGFCVAQAQFEELTTFPYAYPDLGLGMYYVSHRRQADLGPIVSTSTERSLTVATTTMSALVLEPPGGGGGGDINCPVPTYPMATNGLRLVAQSWSNNLMALTILGGQSNAYYDIFTAPMAGGSSCTWAWLGQGQNSNTCYFTGQTNPQATYLLASRLDTDSDGLTDAYEKLISHSLTNNIDSDSDGLPDGWEWKSFGNFDQAANGDYDGDGISNYTEFQYRTDPNTLACRFSLASYRFSGNTATGTIEILHGVPVQMAWLLDSTNFAAAAWTACASNILVTVTNEGAHDLWVGVRGRATNEYWQCASLVRDTTSPALVITNLPSLTVSRALLHLKGYSPEPLASLTYDFTNSIGVATHCAALLTDENYQLAAHTFGTNGFSCLDLGLAPGTNWLSLKAVDQAGNVTVTNLALVLWTGNDTNAPVLTRLWPAAGVQLSGAGFTLKAKVDDDSASLQAVIVANGVTNTAEALVERDGTVWFEGLPLASGTNSVLIIATDYAGNSTSSSFSFVQSSVALTVSPVPEEQLCQLTVTVSGTVGDPSFQVDVNGVAASVDAGGNWTATGVPVNDENTAEFVVTAQPAGNPSARVQTALYLDKPARAYVRRYDLAVTQFEKRAAYPPNSFFDPADLGGNLWWEERVGGMKSTYTTATGGTTGELSYTIWPADVYVPSQTGITYYANGEISTNVAAPSVPLEQCDISGIGMFGTNWAQNYTRKAHAQVVLFTGGKNTPGQQNLFSLQSRVMDRGWVWSRINWGYPTNRGEVPPEKIMLGGFGPLDTNHMVYTALPDGQRVVITPKAQGIPNQEATLPSVVKHRLKITANGTTLCPSSFVANSGFCVGQKVAFSYCLSPPLPDASIVLTEHCQWWLPTSYANTKEEWNSATSCFEYVSCYPVMRVFSRWKDYDEDVSQPCTTYLALDELLQRLATGCWWLTPGAKKVSLYYDLQMSNGARHALSARGLLSVVAPTIISNMYASGGVHLLLNSNGSAHALALKNSNGLGMEIKVDITRPASFQGTAFFTQLIKRSLYYNTTSSFKSEGTVTDWLDRANPYGAGFSFGASSNLLRATLTDVPGVTEGANPFLNTIEIQDDYKTYLRFIPAGEDNIPVTLERLDWGWHGKAIATNGWSLTISNAYGPTLNLTTMAPAWKKVYTPQ